MAKVTLGGKEIEIDEDGFIQEPDKWDNAVAEDIAKVEQAYPMGEDHWKLVNYLRDYYVKYEIAPPIRMLGKADGDRPEEDLRAVPWRPGQGRLQGCGPAEADGVRVRRTVSSEKRVERTVASSQ